MSKRQTVIAGMERKQHPALEEAASKFVEARDERMSLSKKEKQAKLMLIATMQSLEIKKYKFDDAEGVELLVSIDEKIDVAVRETGEEPSVVGEGIDSEPHDDPGIHKGLIAQALQAQTDAGIVETADGDVVPSDKAAPKKAKRAKKTKP